MKPFNDTPEKIELYHEHLTQGKVVVTEGISEHPDKVVLAVHKEHQAVVRISTYSETHQKVQITCLKLDGLNEADILPKELNSFRNFLYGKGLDNSNNDTFYVRSGSYTPDKLVTLYQELKAHGFTMLNEYVFDSWFLKTINTFYVAVVQDEVTELEFDAPNDFHKFSEGLQYHAGEEGLYDTVDYTELDGSLDEEE